MKATGRHSAAGNKFNCWQIASVATLWFMAVLSINLGLVNLMPVPVLDGFQKAMERSMGSGVSGAAKAMEGFVSRNEAADVPRMSAASVPASTRS